MLKAHKMSECELTEIEKTKGRRKITERLQPKNNMYQDDDITYFKIQWKLVKTQSRLARDIA